MVYKSVSNLAFVKVSDFQIHECYKKIASVLRLGAQCAHEISECIDTNQESFEENIYIYPSVWV